MRANFSALDLCSERDRTAEGSVWLWWTSGPHFRHSGLDPANTIAIHDPDVRLFRTAANDWRFSPVHHFMHICNSQWNLGRI